MNERWVCKRCYADNDGAATACVRCGLQRGADISQQAQQEWEAQVQPAASQPAWRGLLRYAWIPVVAIVLIVGFVVNQGQRDLENLAVGDCFDTDADAEEISSVESGACSDPHEFEAFHVTTYEGTGSFPTDGEVEGLFGSECIPAFEGYVGLSYQSSEIVATMITPSEGSWGDGDRGLICILFDPGNAELTTSLRDAQR